MSEHSEDNHDEQQEDLSGGQHSEGDDDIRIRLKVILGSGSCSGVPPSRNCGRPGGECE